MKKILLLITIALLCLLFGCTAKKEYTYFASNPVFIDEDIIKKDFGALTISFPADWIDSTSYFKDMADSKISENKIDYIYAAKYPSDKGYYSNLQILSQDLNKILDIWKFDDKFSQQLAADMSKANGTDVKVENILYGMAGNKQAAVIYLSGIIQEVNTQWIILLVPVDKNHSYNITFCIFADEGRKDAEAIMNSIKFK